MTNIETISTKEAPAAIGPYSQAKKVGNLVFTSGQIPLDPVSGQMTGTEIRGQSEQVMKNLCAVLKAAGTDFDQVRTTSPYFTVEGDYPSGARQILIGKAVADTIGAKTGSVVELSFHPQSAESTETAELKPGATLAGSAVGFNQNPVYVSFSLDEEMKIHLFYS